MIKPKYISVSPRELLQALWCDQIEKIYQETHSSIVLEQDEVSAQIKIVHGEQVWFRFKLRDRRFDGPGWSASPLTDWTYGGPDDAFKLGSAVEESIYMLDPRFSLMNNFTEAQTAFIKNPFDALPFSNTTAEQLVGWFRQWQEINAESNPPFPGFFFAKNIPGLRRRIHRAITKFLEVKDYAYLTTVPTWWHTSRICEELGFSSLYENDKKVLSELRLKLAEATPAQRSKSSWLVMLQFWADLVIKNNFVPEDLTGDSTLILRDATGSLLTFPLTPERNLWQFYKIKNK